MDDQNAKPPERAWAKTVADKLNSDLPSRLAGKPTIRVGDQRRLPYIHEIGGYQENNQPKHEDIHLSDYVTDLLVFDLREDNSWIPRVVIECKLRVTTHDALTYSAKAATHKAVHPYLRYGILVVGQAIPDRLIRHGASIDFMVSWSTAKANDAEREHFLGLIASEVDASRELQKILEDSRLPGRERYQSFHRKLELKKC